MKAPATSWLCTVGGMTSFQGGGLPNTDVGKIRSQSTKSTVEQQHMLVLGPLGSKNSTQPDRPLHHSDLFTLSCYVHCILATVFSVLIVSCGETNSKVNETRHSFVSTRPLQLVPRLWLIAIPLVLSYTFWVSFTLSTNASLDRLLAEVTQTLSLKSSSPSYQNVLTLINCQIQSIQSHQYSKGWVFPFSKRKVGNLRSQRQMTIPSISRKTEFSLVNLFCQEENKSLISKNQELSKNKSEQVYIDKSKREIENQFILSW